jgi:hypothetical protein
MTSQIIEIDETPTTMQTVKAVARALAPAAITLAVGVVGGIVIEKVLKSRTAATEEV